MLILVRERARMRNLLHKIVDAAGVRVSGILAHLFGANGMMAIPGINRTSASAILLDLGPDITVFASRRHVAA